MMERSVGLAVSIKKKRITYLVRLAHERRERIEKNCFRETTHELVRCKNKLNLCKSIAASQVIFVNEKQSLGSYNDTPN